MAKIMVVKTKYATHYYDISTQHKWAAACIEILRERLEIGYIREPSESESDISVSEVDQKILDLTDDEITALPDALRDSTAQRRATVRRTVERRKELHQIELKEYQDVVQLVTTNDISSVTVGRGQYARLEPKAWQPLYARSDYEYESVEIDDAVDALEGS